MRPAKLILGAVRRALDRHGLAEQARVHYGGQARGGGHRLWLTGSVLGVERSLCMTLPAKLADEPLHQARFVAQVAEQVALMRLANGFRP